jgi:hypothetical protein
MMKVPSSAIAKLLVGAVILFRSILSTTLNIEWFPADYDPLAVCNDGTKGAYYFKESIDPSMRNVYVIFLPGGGQCYDEASCKDRWENVGSTYMSSTGFSSTNEIGGLLDSNPNRSPFWGANKAALGYCSSDGYMGDAEASSSTWNWHFRGQRLVYSMIRHLIEEKGLSANSTVLLAGASAGARGIMALSDNLLRDHLPKGSKVALFLDSPYYIDIPPYSNEFEGFPFQEQQKNLYFNTTSIIPQTCSDYYAPQFDNDNVDDKTNNDELTGNDWKCQFGQYRMPFLTQIPYLLIASQYDAYQLQHNTQQTPPYHGSDKNEVNSYTLEFASMTKSLITSLAESSAQIDGKVRGYFSWACYNHAVSSTISFSTLSTETGVTQKDALVAFLATNPYVTVYAVDAMIQEENHSKIENKDTSLRWVDQCEGFACGSGCLVR